MPSISPRALVFALIVSSGAFAASARADALGAVGTLESLTVYSPSSTEYANQHGEFTIRSANATSVRYYFGGSRCAQQGLSETELSVLQRALVDDSVFVTPHYVAGLSGSRCAVAVSVARG